MHVTTLHEVEETLSAMDPETVSDMAYQLAKNHAAICHLTSQVVDCAHVPDEEIRDRVNGMTPAEMVHLVAPMAWVSIDLHTRN